MNKTNKRWVDDFFWWRETRISADRLVYLFERESYQPTKDKLNVLAKLGVSSVLLDTKFAGDAPQLFFDCLPQSLKKGFDNLMTLMKLNFRSWFSDPYSRSVISLIGWQVYHAAKLANIYSSLNLRGIFHHEEAGLEFVTLASEQAGAIRIGTHWSCLSGLNHSTTRNHHIFFVWGEHDAQIVLDSQSTSKYLIMSGCLLSDQTDDEERQKGFEAVQKMKSSGVKYVLALFDNSPPLPNFYRYFFNWLLEDPELGLLLKSKKSQGALMKIGDLDGLMPRAMESGRMFSMDPSSSPADAGMIADFCVGITAISAVCTAALKGARVLYLDYEGLDRGSQKPYSILHSLGPGRCVFQDPDSLRQAVRNHFLDPKTSPELGDVTPILDRLDPFRDGKAGQRIGEFVACYLEELDNCLSSDDAVRSAADKYAEKWGQDKVIRIN